MRNFILALLIFLSGTLISQNLYFVTNPQEFYRINPDNSIDYMSTIDAPLFDIAITPDGAFYGITTTDIRQFDPNSGVSYVVATLPIGTYGSLVCSDQSVLYMINNSTYEIYSYDIINDSMQTVAYIGFSTPGDLTFYKGNLVFPTHTANSSIKAYNLQTNMVSDVYCLNNWGDMSNFFSFTNRFLDCNTNEIIGSDITGMYVFNLENDTYMPLGIDVSQHYIYGLASDNEYMASACYESLTPSNCQLSTAENPVQEYSVFPNPATDFIEITSNGIMQEIAIIDLSGRVISRLENPPPTINLISLASGCYVMKMKIDGRHHAQKFIKQ